MAGVARVTQPTRDIKLTALQMLLIRRVLGSGDRRNASDHRHSPAPHKLGDRGQGMWSRKMQRRDQPGDRFVRWLVATVLCSTLIIIFLILYLFQQP
jgi:hypothetical protein